MKELTDYTIYGIAKIIHVIKISKCILGHDVDYYYDSCGAKILHFGYCKNCDKFIEVNR